MKRIMSFIFIIGFLFLISCQGFTTGFNWHTYETDDFVIFYPDGYHEQALETLYYLEKYSEEVKGLTGNDRDFKTHVVIQDIGLISNGYTDPFTYKIVVFTNRPSSLPVLNSNENWFRVLSIHEFTHMAHSTNYSGTTSLPATLFGNMFGSNVHSPLWVMEGITVYAESQNSLAEGRLNSGYFDAVVASKASSHNLPSLSAANYLHDHYPSGQWYTYGGVFVRYLAEKYGEEKLAQLFKEYGSYHWAPFIGDFFPAIGIDLASQKIYGKTIEELFSEWRQYESKKHQNWHVDGEKIVENKGGYITNLTVANGKLYYFKQYDLDSYPYVDDTIQKLVEYNPETGEERVLTKTVAPIASDLQVKENKVYYTLLDSRQGYPNYYLRGNGAIASLYYYDLKNDKTVKVLADNYKNYFVFSTDKILYVKNALDKFGSEIWLWSSGKKEKIGLTEEYIAELEQYKDKIVVVSKERPGSWGIKYLDLETFTLETIIDTEYAEGLIEVEGDYLYYTANYEGYQAIYQYNLKTGKLAKLTNKGYSINGVSYRDELYFVSLTSEGMGLFRKEMNPQPYLLSDKKERVCEIDYSKLNFKKSKKGYFKSLTYLFKPYMRLFPVLLAGEDALGSNQYTLGFSPYGGLDLIWTSKMLEPLNFSLKNMVKEKEGRSTQLSLSYLAYESYLDGLKNVEFHYKTNFDEENIVGLSTEVEYPRHSLSIKLEKALKKELTGEISYKYLFDESNLHFKISKEKGLADNGKADVNIDEYVYSFKTGYMHKLAEVRKGIWNPNIFIADIYGNAFVDYEISSSSAKSIYGLETIIETGMGNYLNIPVALGVTYSNEEITPHVKVGISF